MLRAGGMPGAGVMPVLKVISSSMLRDGLYVQAILRGGTYHEPQHANVPRFGPRLTGLVAPFDDGRDHGSGGSWRRGYANAGATAAHHAGKPLLYALTKRELTRHWTTGATLHGARAVVAPPRAMSDPLLLDSGSASAPGLHQCRHRRIWIVGAHRLAGAKSPGEPYAETGPPPKPIAGRGLRSCRMSVRRQ